MLEEKALENGNIISNSYYGDKFSQEMFNPPNRYVNPAMENKLQKFRKVVKNRFLTSSLAKNYQFPRMFEDEKGVQGKYGRVQMMNFMPKITSQRQNKSANAGRAKSKKRDLNPITTSLRSNDKFQKLLMVKNRSVENLKSNTFDSESMNDNS